jgi:myo-inositol-1(or 4)-monophosphatase
MTPQDIAERRDCVEEAVRQAGAMALSHFRHPDTLNVKLKGLHDIVTVADQAVEDFLVRRISGALPADGIVGEEGGRRGSPAGACWFVDPIDGTANFARGIPLWCVSVGLVADGRVVIGIIYDPVTDELFSACRGLGATCNGRAIHASAATTPQTSRIGLGFNSRSDPAGHVLAIQRVLAMQGEYVRLGSAALSLAYIANGRIEGYYAPVTHAWDVVAGICLVQEAGGLTNDFVAEGGLERGNRILATAPGVAGFVHEALKGQ